MGEKRLAIEIRPAQRADDYSGCVQLQRAVWKFSDADVISADMLRTVQRFGGILLVAEISLARPIGFVFSFSVPHGKVALQHSHMLAVAHPFRNAGVGERLKKSQFEEARRAGCQLITWTFDPLEAKNAYFNLNKLGAVVRRYYPELYGETSSELHRGIGTDRFLAEWRVDAPPLPAEGRPPAHFAEGTLVLQGVMGDRGLLLPGPVSFDSRHPSILAEIPFDIQDLKHRDLSLALEWRRVTREVFSHYLSHGYEILRVKREMFPDRVFYQMTKVCTE